MIVLTSCKAIEDINGIILPIFIIFIMMQEFIRLPRNLIFKLYYLAYYVLQISNKLDK